MGLQEYKRKRKFKETPEPAGKVERSPVGKLKFAIQKHHATRLHYDFRLEMQGVLKSWAVPKGPTLDPGEKRLAMMVEDHPMDYMLFEGIIPAGNYGAGTVMVWDKGAYRGLNEGGPEAGLAKGDLKFALDGKKLKGEFALVRLRSRRPGSKGNEWLLIKKRDAHAKPGWDADAFDWSVMSKRSLAQIAEDEGSATWTSSRPAAGAKGKIRPKSTSGEDEMGRRKAQAARRTLEMTQRSNSAAPPVDPASLPGAEKARMPAQVSPMLATLVSEPPAGDDWLFEIKFDGVRAIAFVSDGKVRLQSRNLNEITAHYPEISDLPELVGAREAVIDGEVVVLDAEGRPRFERLQQRMNMVPDQRLRQEYPVLYFAYDLLYLDGYDLRRVPLEKRKATLRAILRTGANGQHVHFSDHQAGQGQALLDLARQRQLEGVIAKRRQSTYVERRSRDWLKVKIVQEAEYIVGGYTEPRRSREHFGSLVLGERRDDGSLVHVGNAGSGFTHVSQKRAWDRLKDLRTDEKPFTGRVVTPEKPYWIRPELTARVKYTEITNDGKLRAPVVLEVRERPSEEPSDSLFSGAAKEETVSVDGHALRIQNLDKVFFPEHGYTKRDVIEYYFRIAPTLLPHMQGRPVSMKRYPNGIHKPFFFQKEAGEHMPDWVRTERIRSEEGKTQFINYVICNDRATLVYLANLGCIEQNLWMSRVGSLDNPDFILFDLDPGEKTSFDMVVEVAQVLRGKLDRVGLTGYPKTSGARGMHVYVPLVTEYTYDHSRTFAELVSMLVAQDVPRLVTQERSLKRRPQDRIYLDFLQNGHSKTVPPPYSLRAKPGATLSAPLDWTEVKKGLDPAAFDIKTIWERLSKRGDLFAGVLNKPQRLESALDRLRSGG